MAAGACDACRLITAAVFWGIVVSYGIKFWWFTQPLDVWDSWRFDDAFFTVAPAVFGVMFALIALHYIFFKCVPVCCSLRRRRRDPHGFIELEEI
jgi:hypothetical protein